jgi:solute carrier family 12 sodium/potassium/chloride transporter 2
MNQENNDVERPADAKTLAEQVKEKKQTESKAFGTFSGVFAPTLLTILSVIMFLREGWVVGNAGLLGAWLIILVAFGITGLSLSSITTNIRIGAGGAFSVISQSLGLEVGGSIGVPLYLSQALAVSMYIFGFRAGWLWIFPDHPALIVDLVTFGVLFAIAFISAGLAFKIQYLIMAVVALSLISVAGAVFQGSMQHSVQWWGNFLCGPCGRCRVHFCDVYRQSYLQYDFSDHRFCSARLLDPKTSEGSFWRYAQWAFCRDC